MNTGATGRRAAESNVIEDERAAWAGPSSSWRRGGVISAAAKAATTDAEMAARRKRASRQPAYTNLDNRTFVLVVGHAHGRRPTTQRFPTEALARTAFLKARLSKNPKAPWAELSTVEGDSGRKPLAWFGTDSSPLASGRPQPALETRPRWWSRSRRP